MQKIFALVLLIAITVSCRKSADPVAERNATIDSVVTAFRTELLHNQLDSVFAKYDFNGGISVSQNGRVIYEKYSGFEDFKTKKPLDSNSIFAIGSLSKQFTAAAIFSLEEQKKLSTNDPAAKFLDHFKAAKLDKITVMQLLNHTSGINDLGPGLISEPGKDFHYSNKGYRYLGDIIAITSGSTSDAVYTQLFRKAGLRNTFTATTFRTGAFAGANLGTKAQFSVVGDMPKRLANEQISIPAGGILSTVNDLHRWNYALYSGKIIGTESLKKFERKSSERGHYVLGKVGYGAGIMMNLGKPQVFFHSGYVKGSPSLLLYYPETKTSVAILSNIADETKGKEGFFEPHAEVKKVVDGVEIAAENVKKQFIKMLDAK